MNLKTRFARLTRVPSTLQALFTLALLCGCATTLAPGQLEQFEIVDCELPGQTLRIGSSYATTGRARALRTGATDCAIRGGYFVQADQSNYQTALKVWLPQAESGDLAAQLYLGQIYEKGLGQRPDFAAAVRWYQRAADAGFAPAQTALAVMLEKGWPGQTPQPERALALYRQAAQLKEALVFKSELNDREADVRKLRQELDAEQAKTQALRLRLQSKTAQLKRQLQALERELLRAKAENNAHAAKQAAGEIVAMQARQQENQQALLAAESTVQAQLGAKQALAAENLAPLGAAKVLKIELLEPRSMPMRGLLAVPVSAPTRVHISARISGPSPVSKVSINGNSVVVDAESVVHADLEIHQATTLVEIIALDQAGNSAKLPLVLTQKNLLPEPQTFAAARQSFGRYHALVIGNDQYQQWESLDTPRADAQAVAQLLQDSYGFEVTLLLNVKRADVFRALAKLRQTLGEADNLLVYYSGHGSWDSANERGYWIPVDGAKDDISNYISSADITDQLSVIAARQILVVADACYAGVLVGSVAEQAEPPRRDRIQALQALAQLRSRKVISSGNIRQVLDGGAGAHSIFAHQFLESLRKRQDAFPARELYQEIAPRVAEAAAGFGEQQEPQFGQLRWAGHIAGDFIFVPKGAM